jgi:hypothetical protein
LIGRHLIAQIDFAGGKGVMGSLPNETYRASRGAFLQQGTGSTFEHMTAKSGRDKNLLRGLRHIKGFEIKGLNWEG